MAVATVSLMVVVMAEHLVAWLDLLKANTMVVRRVVLKERLLAALLEWWLAERLAATMGAM